MTTKMSKDLEDLFLEFSRWVAEVDCAAILDTFDMALGFCAGRFPDREDDWATFAAACNERLTLAWDGDQRAAIQEEQPDASM